MNRREKITSETLIDEELLIRQCLSGHALAQKQLYERFAPKMFGVCLRYAVDHSMAEDFLQEGFIRVFLKLDSYGAKGSLEGWMRRIMVNTALEKLRKKDILRNSLDIEAAGQQHMVLNSESAEYVVTENIIERDTEEIYPAEMLYQAIKEMPMGFRTVFNLFAIEEYSHKEIGAMLGISEGTSKSQYARARTWLQKRLTERKKSSNARK